VKENNSVMPIINDLLALMSQRYTLLNPILEELVRKAG
jgi:hypothetical protein